MKGYIEIAFQSRGLEPCSILCERCNTNVAQDVDHIDGRGGKRNIDNRMYDPYNLIFLCRACHTNKGGWDRKQKAKEIVKCKII